jgi:hypothetical protein
MPVKTDDRDGLHEGTDTNAFLNNTPSRATLSKFGVLTIVLPYALQCSQV